MPPPYEGILNIFCLQPSIIPTVKQPGVCGMIERAHNYSGQPGLSKH